mgnify:CR=1 FL=1|tara:strand:+ start:3513 stop:3707 length:195 start_codon:yes stop_codon:yes gene_type:complete
MSKRLNYGRSWPAYVQDKDEIPPVYKTGCLYSWKEWFEIKKQEKLIKDKKIALDILNSLIDSLK